MDNLTKETRKTLPWKKKSTAYYAGPPLRRRFPGWHLECTAMSTKYLAIILIFMEAEWI
jgi:cysteinyl-tRNA synthetase